MVKKNKLNGNARKLKNNFKHGCTQTVGRRLKEMQAYREEIRTVDTTALVVVKKQVVEQRVQQEFPKFTL